MFTTAKDFLAPAELVIRTMLVSREECLQRWAWGFETWGWHSEKQRAGDGPAGLGAGESGDCSFSSKEMFQITTRVFIRLQRWKRKVLQIAHQQNNPVAHCCNYLYSRYIIIEIY